MYLVCHHVTLYYRCYSGTSKLDPVNKAPSNTRDLGSGHTSANLPDNPRVSAPHDGKGGVFQYDFGKSIQDQKFRTTGFLNQPLRLLRAAVNELGAQYEEEGHQLEDAINLKMPSTSLSRKHTGCGRSTSDRTAAATGCMEAESSILQTMNQAVRQSVVMIHQT